MQSHCLCCSNSDKANRVLEHVLKSAYLRKQVEKLQTDEFKLLFCELNEIAFLSFVLDFTQVENCCDLRGPKCPE